MAAESTPPCEEDPTSNWMFRDDAPDWTIHTPDDCDYELIMWDGCGGAGQQVRMSRTEFLVLKSYLAAMRGLVVEENLENRLADLGSAMNADQCFLSGDLDQVISNLRAAREMFRRCPDLVMLKGDTFDADLDAIHLAADAAIPNRSEPV